jgi:hypothetical protein
MSRELVSPALVNKIGRGRSIRNPIFAVQKKAFLPFVESCLRSVPRSPF